MNIYFKQKIKVGVRRDANIKPVLAKILTNKRLRFFACLHIKLFWDVKNVKIKQKNEIGGMEIYD
jgi:hypothetical protein